MSQPHDPQAGRPAPAPAPTTAPPRPASARFPGWAWAVLAVGVVFALGSNLGSAWAATQVWQAFAPAPDCCAPDPVTPSDDPFATEQASEPGDPDEPGATAEPPSPAPSEGAGAIPAEVPLDLDYAGPALYWAVPFDEAWTTEVFDEGGVNRFRHAASGCVVTTSQNVQPVTAEHDEASTEQLLAALRERITGSSAPAVDPSVTVVLPVTSEAGETAITLASERLEYRLDGVDYVSVTMARSMPGAGAYHYAALDCTAEGIAADGATRLFTGLGLTTF